MISKIDARSVTAAISIIILILLLALIAYMAFFYNPDTGPPRRSLPVTACHVCEAPDEIDDINEADEAAFAPKIN